MLKSQGIVNSFKFSSTSNQINWDKIVDLDIDRIIEKRDLEALMSNFDIIVNIDIKSEFEKKGLNEIFFKLFKLSQLAIDFLLHCKSFLQRSLESAEVQLQKLKQELYEKSQKDQYKMQCDAKKNNLVLTAHIEGAAFKCSSCQKVFVSKEHLEAHEIRRHGCKTDGSEKTLEGECKVTVNTLPILERGLKENEEGIFLTNTNENKDSHICCSQECDKRELNCERENKNEVERFEITEYRDFLTNDALRNSTPVNKNFQSLLINDVEKDDKYVGDFDKSNNISPSVPRMEEIQTQEIEHDCVVNKEPKDIVKINTMLTSQENSLYYNYGSSKEIKNFSIEKLKNECDVLSDTSSGTSKDDIFADKVRRRLLMEQKFKKRLRYLGIDPHWKKIPDSVAEKNNLTLSAQRKSLAKKYKDFSSVQSKLQEEVTFRLHEKQLENS